MSQLTLFQKCKRIVFRLLLILLVCFIFLVIYLDSMVRDEFSQTAWDIPAKVYARPLSFSLGQNLRLKDLLQELKMLGYRKKIKATHQGEFEQYDNSLVINTRGFQFWDGNQPEQVLEITIENSQITLLRDFASQKNVSFLRLDPVVLGNIHAGKNEDRQLVALEQLPENLITALLITEDRNFYDHWGVSLKGIARAFWSNLSKGEMSQGGSTLTQQLMKNHFLTNERTFWRKFKEAIMAVLTEFHYDKKTILEAYINEVYLGQDHSAGIFGFSRASEFYFDRSLSDLDLAQVALLVGIVKGPSFYNPRRNPKRAKERRDLVLSIMLNHGLITQEDFDDATSRNLMVVKKSSGKTSNVPAFMNLIKRELQQDYSLSQLHKKGLKLFTSLDPIVQNSAEKTLTKQLNNLEKNNKSQQLQGAVIVSDIESGDILAMVGDRRSNFVGFNRAVDAYRQTGSVIKPFVYLSALQQREKFNLLTKIEDAPFILEGSDGSQWNPKNYDQQSHGLIELQEGLINSYNQATARLALDVGIKNVAETIVDAGFARDLPPYPSIALGAQEMSPLEVLRLYQVLANNGVGIRSAGIIAVQDHEGRLLQRFPRNTNSRFDAADIFLIKYLLREVVERGTAKTIGQQFKQQFAGKTGTTNDLRDSWYVGFGEKRLGVVWLGRDDNQPIGLTGASGALRVWSDLFRQLGEPSITMGLPDDLVWAYKKEGFFSQFSDCKKKQLVPFYPEQLPKEYAVCE